MTILWKRKDSYLAIIFGVVTLAVTSFYFNNKTADNVFVIAAIFIVISFFIGLRFFQRRWLSISQKKFTKRLFVTSLLIRLCAMAILYAIFMAITGTPFSIDPMDSTTYDTWAKIFVQQFTNNNFNIFKIYPYYFDDIGAPLYYGIIYFFLGKSIVAARIINCVISSFSVLLIYKITRIIWQEKVARLAGIIAMLSPLIFFYDGTHAKESVLLFVTLLSIYQAILIKVRPKFSLLQVLQLLLTITALFSLRLVVGIIFLMSLFLTYFIHSKLYAKRQIISTFMLIPIIAGLILILIQLGSYKQTKARSLEYLERGGGRSLEQIQSENTLARFASTPLFIAISIPAPFPTLVRTNMTVYNQSEQWYHIGGVLVWNTVSFFAFLGLFSALRYRLRESLFLWSFAFGYLLALVLSAYVTSIRFQIVSMPLMIIFVAVGISAKLQNYDKYWGLYLACMSITIFVWNYFKLAGRGMF